MDLGISLVSYSNPDHEDCNGGHCEAPFSNNCDNYFTFRLRTQASASLLSPENTTNDYGQDVFSFDESVLDLLGISNPLTYQNLNPTVRASQLRVAQTRHIYEILRHMYYTLLLSSHTHRVHWYWKS